eukprot:3271312-Alexandrium_andersonii.AAC.1
MGSVTPSRVSWGPCRATWRARTGNGRAGCIGGSPSKKGRGKGKRTNENHMEETGRTAERTSFETGKF